nr:rho-related GTP-binding protein RhoU [Vulpes vulpes]
MGPRGLAGSSWEADRALGTRRARSHLQDRGAAGSPRTRARRRGRGTGTEPVRKEMIRENGATGLAVVSVDGRPVRLQLCDTAGQDEFDKLRPLCYTNTDIFLLCFSVVSPSSFQNVSEKWVPEIRCHCPKAPIILVGTQSDLREDVKVLIELDKCKEKPVPEEAAKLCAEEMKAASYIECSALTQKNLKEVFDAAIVAGIQYSDTQQQPKKSKSRTPDKMKNLSKSWWKKYCCFV